MTSTAPSPTFIQDLYARMLLTRIVDDYTWKLHTQGFIDFVASCRGHEAAQVGTAVCIEVKTLLCPITVTLVLYSLLA